MKKFLTSLLICVLIAAQSLSACTIFAVGKGITVDGSTMISHTCDSTSDDLRLWLIPSMPEGEPRDIVLFSRAGADYSEFPEVKNYGVNSMVLGSYIPEHDTYRYIHAAYSFINEKGLAMGESTCPYDRSTEQGKKLTEVYSRDEGILDCYYLQDLALENCATAREAVEFIVSMIDIYGWNGTAECINICDGNESWVMECYGAKVWVAFRVPDDAVFVAANRCRINTIDLDDPENWLYSANIIDYALENDLWDGEGEFVPCEVYAPYPTRTYSTRREWMAMTLLDPSLNLDPEETDPSANWPLYVYPAEEVSVETIRALSSNYYQGTPYDTSKTFEAGPYGNPLNPRHVERAINCFRCTYIQVSTINAAYPEEVRALSYFGWGAPDSAYITPIFGSQLTLPEHFGKGVRTVYDPESGWWNASVVQQLATINYQDAIKRLYEVRDPEMLEQYETTKLVQDAATLMIEAGDRDAALELLTLYSNQRAEYWFDKWSDLADEFTTTYMLGNKNMRTAQPTDWWKENVVDKGWK